MIDPDNLRYLEPIDAYHHIKKSERDIALEKKSQKEFNETLQNNSAFCKSPDKSKNDKNNVLLMDKKNISKKSVELIQKHSRKSSIQSMQADLNGIGKALNTLSDIIDDTVGNKLSCLWIWSHETNQRKLHLLTQQICIAKHHCGSLNNNVTGKGLLGLTTALETIVSIIQIQQPTLKNHINTVDQIRLRQVNIFNRYIKKFKQNYKHYELAHDINIMKKDDEIEKRNKQIDALNAERLNDANEIAALKQHLSD